MKILQVHNKYKYTGGEWTVLNQEKDLLQKDHVVEQFIADNTRELRSVINQIKLISSAHYRKSSKKAVSKHLNKGNYHLMHVHNFFPLLTPSVFEAAREQGIPSVLSLHNFRLIHPNGLLYHNGKVDERSVKGSAWKCVPDGVYRNSILQTAIVAHMIEYHRKHGTWQKYPSAFISLSEFSKSKFVAGGLPEERIFVKPNFIEDPLNEYPQLDIDKPKEEFYIYIGRISGEKGIKELITFWLEQNSGSKLIIAGDGPLKSELQKKTMGRKDIEWKGHLEKEEILGLLSTAKAMLFPTKCYENFPITILEAMSVGCPVITSNIGNPARIIDHGKTGFHINLSQPESIMQQLKKLRDKERVISLSRNARRTYLEKYTPEINYRILMDIYEKAAELEKRLISVH